MAANGHHWVTVGQKVCPAPLLPGQSRLILSVGHGGVGEDTLLSSHSSILENRGLDLMLEFSQLAG